MAQDMRWFWDPTKDEHGTTTSNFNEASSSLTARNIRNNANAAQWTTVSAIPKAVSATYKKKPN